MPRKKTAKKTSRKKAPKLGAREQFFKDHPNARWMLGLFAVSVAILIGVMWRNYQYHMAVAEILGAEDIFYNPYL